MNTAKETGIKKEALAAEYLRQNGMRILEQNFRCRQGEIDIVGRHKGYLTFVEVKYRRTDINGTPTEAVTPAKQKKICRAADYYRMKHRCNDAVPVRYDVVAITGNEITWYENAFVHLGF